MGGNSAPAIWKVRKASASAKAAQTITVGEGRRPKPGTEVTFAGTGAAGTLRMMTQLAIGQKKAPASTGA
jgi:hypothetical protein